MKWVVVEAYVEPIDGAAVGDTADLVLLLEHGLTLWMQQTSKDVPQRWIRASREYVGGPRGARPCTVILMETE